MSLIHCALDLNNKDVSILSCPDVGALQAFFGQRQGRDNPVATAIQDIGPIPKDIYFIVD